MDSKIKRIGNEMNSKKHSSNFKDLTGLKFGKLTVLSYVKENKISYWKCLCECGNTKNVYRNSLISGKTKTCGCSRKIGNRRDLFSSFNGLYARHIKQANFRKLGTTLTKEQFKVLSQSNCFYCGINPEHIAKPSKGCSKEWVESGKFLYNGIDRMDNTKGYDINNCVPCCGQCNRMKLNYTYESFLDRIKKIYKNHVEKII